MRIGFNNKTFIIADPIPASGEKKVFISRRALLFPMIVFECKSRFEFPHQWAKLFFFSLNEGPFLTARKVRTARLHKSLLKTRHLVFVFGQCEGDGVVAVGPLHTMDLDVACFPSSCVAAIPAGRDEDWCLQRTFSFLKSRPQLAASLFHYSPYSGLPVEFALVEALNERSFASEETIPRFDPPSLASTETRRAATAAGRCLFIAGSGAYTHAYVMPTLGKLRRHTVIDLNPALAAQTQKKFRFERADTSCERAFKELESLRAPLVIVATYHSTHADIAELALKYNANALIFIEKPPVTEAEQLDTLLRLKEHGALFDVGYNRRYAPMTIEAQRRLQSSRGPTIMTCIVKELRIPETHWYYWPSQGTRVMGNLCHWVDLGTMFIDHAPVSVYAESAPGHPQGDEITVVVHYEDGSRLTLMATDAGNSLRGVQEYIDIRRDDMTVIIEDYRKLTVQHGPSNRIHRAVLRDKGHQRMYRQLIKNIENGCFPVYPMKDLIYSTETCLAIRDAVEVGGLQIDLSARLASRKKYLTQQESS